MLTLEAGERVAPPLRTALHKRNGFTLLELLVVVAIIAIATAGVTFALRDSSTTALEREAQRVSAILEAGRSQSRTTGLAVLWQPEAEGFTLKNSASKDGDKLQPWLTPSTIAQVSEGRAFVLLGPEPIIAAQSVSLSLEGRSVQISTDGLKPFRIDNGLTSGQAPSGAGSAVAGTR
jgi:general secretion pathway protein H